MKAYNNDGALVLAENGITSYRIIIADEAMDVLRFAAKELCSFLEEITSASFDIYPDTIAMSEHEIILGFNRHSSKLMSEADMIHPDVEHLGSEGYLLCTINQQLLIVGATPRATMYGVYGLLEDHLGCRWFTPEESHVPRRSVLSIDPLNEIRSPSFEYRNNGLRDCWHGVWAARNRLNGVLHEDFLLPEIGGGVKFGPGGLGHTSLRLVPPDKHFTEHPEYYCRRDGKRVPNEICWTNEGALAIATHQIITDIQDNPQATVFSVSQMDGKDWRCQCRSCREKVEETGAESGAVLSFVNRVAEAIEEEHPEKLLITFAYRWTRHPPRELRPKKNVIVFLCNIECCFSHPLESCDYDANRRFRDQIREWAQLSDRLWVWTYETNFHHYLIPLPNYHIWGANARFLNKHHVSGLFTQDDYQNTNAELNALGGYIRAKLLWDVDYKEEQAIEEFLKAFYGKAASYIREYMRLLTDKVTTENIHVGIYAMYPWTYLTADVIENANELFDKAETVVSHSEAHLSRVKAARLSLYYAMIEIRRRKASCDRTRKNHEHCFYYTDDGVLNHAIPRFLEIAAKASITTLQEGNYPVNCRMPDIVLKPLMPAETKPTLPGVQCTYAQTDAVSVFDSGLPDQSSQRNAIPDLCPETIAAGKPSVYIFTGFLLVRKKGIYTFTLSCCGRVNLHIGGSNVPFWYEKGSILDKRNTGEPSTISADVALLPGMHAYRLVYHHVSSPDTFMFWLAGPNLEKQIIPPSMLYIQKE